MIKNRLSKLFLVLGALVFTSMDVAGMEQTEGTGHVLAYRPPEVWKLIVGYLDKKSENALNEVTRLSKGLHDISNVIRGKRMSRGFVFNMATVKEGDTARVCLFLQNYQDPTSLAFKNIKPEILLNLLRGLALAPMTKLTSLALSWTHQSSGPQKEFMAVAETLSQMPQLTHLDLSYNYGLEAAVAKALVAPLTQLTEIRSLDLSHTAIGAEGVKFAQALSQMTQLTHLDLGGIKLDAAGAKAVVSVLDQMMHCKELGLSNDALGKAGVEALAAAITPMMQLTKFDLGGHDLGAAGARLAHALSKLTKLTSLTLWGSGLNAEDTMTALMAAIAQMPGLTHLDLSYNGFGVAGAGILAPTLARITGLTHLELIDNVLGANGAMAALAPALAQLINLTHLNLEENDLGSVGGMALAPALAQMTSLTHLNLALNDLRVAQIRALAPSLHQLTNLTFLNLSFNTLGEKACKALEGVQRRLPKLKISLQDNK